MIAVVLADIPNPVDLVEGAAGAVGGAMAHQAADTFLQPIGHAIAKGLAGAAKKISEELLHFITNSATVNFRQGWWAGDRAQTLVREVATLALVLTLGFLLLALIQGLFAGDVGAMVRATLLEVPMTILATVALVAVTELLLGLVDGASSMVLAGVPEALGHFFEGFGSVSTIESGGFSAMFMVGVFIVGAILVWIELVVRSSLIYLLMAAAPLTLAARVWPAARGAWKRLAELGIALIASKFVIALALGLGAAALAGGGPANGDLGTQAGLDLAGLLTGASLMLLAAFSPFVVLRLLPIVEAAVVAQGISRLPVRAAQTATQVGYYGQGLSRMAGARAATTSAATSAATGESGRSPDPTTTDGRPPSGRPPRGPGQSSPPGRASSPAGSPSTPGVPAPIPVGAMPAAAAMVVATAATKAASATAENAPTITSPGTGSGS